MLQYTFGAMTANRKKLLDKIAKFRNSKVKDEQGAKDRLEELHKFLTDHETMSPSDCTQKVLNGQKSTSGDISHPCGINRTHVLTSLEQSRAVSSSPFWLKARAVPSIFG